MYQRTCDGQVFVVKPSIERMAIAPNASTSNAQPGAVTPTPTLTAATPARRLRWAKGVPQPKTYEVPYAKARPEFNGMDEGDYTALVLASPAWRTVMVPRLEQLDQARSRFGRRLYNAAELESVLLYQHVAGLRSYRATRDRLASDRGRRAREVLGLHRSRTETYQQHRQRLTDGIPSEASISRHRKRFGEVEREQSYQQLFEHFVQETIEDLLADPERTDEPFILHGDGSALLTHYTAPHTVGATEGPYGPKRPVTAPEAGFVGARSDNHDKAGSGWNSLTVATATSLPLLHRLIPLGQSEVSNMRDLFHDDWQRIVGRHLPEDRLAFFSADGAFNDSGWGLRSKLRELRIIENIAISSRGYHETTAEARREQVIEIEGQSSWYADGHRQLHCVCGKGSASRVFEIRRGQAVTRVEGKCFTCGSITVTSGQWRTGRNRRPRTAPGQAFAKGKRSKMVAVFWRCQDAADREQADWLFGNALTYDDPMATRFAHARYQGIEGFHASLVTRFRLLNNKHWFRKKSQANIAFLATYSVMHALASEQRRLARVVTTLAQPPGSAPPAALAA